MNIGADLPPRGGGVGINFSFTVSASRSFPNSKTIESKLIEAFLDGVESMYAAMVHILLDTPHILRPTNIGTLNFEGGAIFSVEKSCMENKF